MAQADGLAGTVSGEHTYVDDGTYSVTVCVTADVDPTPSGCADLEVTVANVDPAITLSALDEAVTEGTRVTLTSAVTDAGSTDPSTATWTVTQDGATVASGHGF